MADETMGAGEFKAQCLKVMERVKRTKRSVTITKRKKPIAKLVPLEEGSTILFGKMRGSVKILGDIISPIDEGWDAAR